MKLSNFDGGWERKMGRETTVGMNKPAAMLKTPIRTPANLPGFRFHRGSGESFWTTRLQTWQIPPRSADNLAHAQQSIVT